MRWNLIFLAGGLAHVAYMGTILWDNFDVLHIVKLFWTDLWRLKHLVLMAIRCFFCIKSLDLTNLVPLFTTINLFVWVIRNCMYNDWSRKRKNMPKLSGSTFWWFLCLCDIDTCFLGRHNWKIAEMTNVVYMWRRFLLSKHEFSPTLTLQSINV